MPLAEIAPPAQTDAALSASGTLLPNGRKITPAGAWFATAPYPFAVAVRPDGGQLAIPSVGWPFALNILDPGTGARRLFRLRARRQIPPGSKSVSDVEVINGVTYSTDGRSLYVSTGDSGAVDVYDTADWHKVRRLNLNGALRGDVYEQSFSGALVLSRDGKRLFVLDQANWRVVTFDIATGTRSSCVPTGVAPFALALDTRGDRLYVANAGLFEYKTLPGVNAKDLLHTGLRFPPTGYPSREARAGTTVEGHSIPGLGDENNERGSSVWTYTVGSEEEAPRVTARLRLGRRLPAMSWAAQRRWGSLWARTAFMCRWPMRTLWPCCRWTARGKPAPLRCRRSPRRHCTSRKRRSCEG